jgi:hypothetical protein
VRLFAHLPDVPTRAVTSNPNAIPAFSITDGLC